MYRQLFWHIEDRGTVAIPAAGLRYACMEYVSLCDDAYIHASMYV